MASIVDVARRAGVSASTVSHVVNRTRPVRPETARLVRAAIAEIGFTPNSLARSLKRASSNSVGIAISAIQNPYFSDIIFSIEAECARLGLMVFLSDTEDDPARELQVVRALHERRVDGIILAPSPEPELALRYIEENKIPCVLVDRLVSNKFDQVGVQNKYAVELLVRHLIGHGHRRIGYIGGQPGFATQLERIEGYKSTLKSNSIALDPALIEPANATASAAFGSASRLLQLNPRPTAIVTGNNLATISAMRAIRAQGLRVPADVALVGIDDFEWADAFEPRLTVVAQPCEEIGRRAASMLVHRIKDADRKKQTVRLKPTLVVRDSCGCQEPGADTAPLRQMQRCEACGHMREVAS
jgi:LacI family transcriptional regulator